jgi:RNA polymerase sigma factor (sigma-70 family)
MAASMEMSKISLKRRRRRCITLGGYLMDLSPTTRLSLLARLHDLQDERAWMEFTEIYTPLVQRLARQRNLREADAADLVQEVFQAVARAMERQVFDPERGSFRGWLFSIARNLAVNFVIRQARQPQGSGDTGTRNLLEELEAPSAEDSAVFDAEYQRQLLYWAIEQVKGEFSELAWQVFWRVGVEGHSPVEVARAVGTTVGTVYHYKSRIMARLRRKIKQVEGST